MPQYLLAVHGNEDDYATIDPESIQQMFQDVDAFNQTARDAGIWVFAGGLQPAPTATVVDGQGASPVFTDGPYLETKEHIGGFWIFELPDLDAALDWAARGSRACQGPVEVRPFQDDPSTGAE